MIPCKHLDYTEGKYDGCEIRDCAPHFPNVRYWFRGPRWTDNGPGEPPNPSKVQFCGQGRGRINGVFECYNGEMPCYEAAEEATKAMIDGEAAPMIEIERPVPVGPDEEPGCWVDPSTGEMLAERREGAIWIPDDEIPVTPAGTDESWFQSPAFGDWYTERLARLTGELEALKAQTRARIARAEAALKAHRFRHEGNLQALVRGLLDGKRKSVQFSAGSAGWRKSTGWEIADEDEACLWAAEHCPAALRIRRSLMVSEIPAGTDEIPGARRPREDKFFARVAKAAGAGEEE